MIPGRQQEFPASFLPPLPKKKRRTSTPHYDLTFFSPFLEIGSQLFPCAGRPTADGENGERASAGWAGEANEFFLFFPLFPLLFYPLAARHSFVHAGDVSFGHHIPRLSFWKRLLAARMGPAGLSSTRRGRVRGVCARRTSAFSGRWRCGSGKPRSDRMGQPLCKSYRCRYSYS